MRKIFAIKRKIFSEKYSISDAVNVAHSCPCDVGKAGSEGEDRMK